MTSYGTLYANVGHLNRIICFLETFAEFKFNKKDLKGFLCMDYNRLRNGLQFLTRFKLIEISRDSGVVFYTSKSQDGKENNKIRF